MQGIDKKHPDNMTRAEKVEMIRALKRDGQTTEAYKFWLTHAPRIGRATFESIN